MLTPLVEAVAAIALLVSLNACGKKLPDPVLRKDGYAYIPIADTAFLIPEKTWLKSYGRKSTDGSVGSFNLHVTAPDVQPWSQEVNAKIYPPAGPGQRVDVFIMEVDEPLVSQYESFYKLPPVWGRVLQEVTSDLADSGLRKFRDPKLNDPAFYLRVENEHIKYFIRCDNDEGYPANRQFCHLRFPWNRKIYADLTFTRNYLPHSIRMADQIAAKLKEFETAALIHQKTPASN
jgi:hypothetical protein